MMNFTNFKALQHSLSHLNKAQKGQLNSKVQALIKSKAMYKTPSKFWTIKSVTMRLLSSNRAITNPKIKTASSKSQCPRKSSRHS